MLFGSGDSEIARKAVNTRWRKHRSFLGFAAFPNLLQIVPDIDRIDREKICLAGPRLSFYAEASRREFPKLIIGQIDGEVFLIGANASFAIATRNIARDGHERRLVPAQERSALIKSPIRAIVSNYHVELVRNLSRLAGFPASQKALFTAGYGQT